MSYIVEITQVATGIMRSVDFKDCDWELDDFCCWSEGNFSCDCNREMFWYESGGELDPDNECTRGRYTVVCRSMSGEVLHWDGMGVATLPVPLPTTEQSLRKT
jgi:hypothetical protein